MIPKVQEKTSQASWQSKLSQAVNTLEELAAMLNLDPKDLALHPSGFKDFPLRVPRGFIERMGIGDPHDPLLLQVLPTAQEWLEVPGYTADPLEEKQQNPVPGLLHKYHGRILLTIAGGCAINCRYCFRRNFPYQENNPGRLGWERCLDYIRQDSSIREVIFSGGDPLLVADEHLVTLVKKINLIPHVTRLRIHSRLPIVIPERVTDELVKFLTQNRLKPVLVLHCNHPNEIDQSVENALDKLQGVTLLNQSVLLRGINDDAATLAQLSERLFAAGVMPYYLHLLDKVKGAAHFDCAEAQAKQILQQLLTQLPGYLVPKLVKEVPWAQSKIPIL